MKYVYLVAAVLLFSVTAAAQNPRREARLQERYERHQAAMRSMDSLVLSRDFRFMPNTVQLMPAGRMNYITNIRYSIDVYPNGSVEFFLPFIYGAVAPYNMVLLNYLSARVADYTAVQTDQGWKVSFSVTLPDNQLYSFTFNIFSISGEVNLIVNSSANNTVSYTGTILGRN